jgi:hypothetical protein
MVDPDNASQLHGASLRRFIDEVRREFFARRAREVGDGYQQINSARVVTIEVYDDLSVDAQAAIAADVVRAKDEIVLIRNPEEVFTRSDTPQAYIADLICEVVYQELMDDPSVVMEDESREALFD